VSGAPPRGQAPGDTAGRLIPDGDDAAGSLAIAAAELGIVPAPGPGAAPGPGPAPKPGVAGSAAPRRRASRFLRNRVAVFGAVIVAAFVLLAVLAPVLAPYDPLKTSFLAVRKAPGPAHWLGTDELGRDVLSRLIWGHGPPFWPAASRSRSPWRSACRWDWPPATGGAGWTRRSRG